EGGVAAAGGKHVAARGGNGLSVGRDGPTVDHAVVRRRRRQTGGKRVRHGYRAGGRSGADVVDGQCVSVGAVTLLEVACVALADRQVGRLGNRRRVAGAVI